MWLSTVPKVLTGETKNVSRRASSFVGDRAFSRRTRHDRGPLQPCATPPRPVYEGIDFGTEGVMLETDADIASHAREIYLQAGRSHAMPPGNVTAMTPDERKLLVAWFESADEGKTAMTDDTAARPPARLRARPAKRD